MNLNYEQKMAEGLSEVRRNVEKELIERSHIYKNFVGMVSDFFGEKNATKDGLDQTHRILIALGVAIATGSESAIEWNITRALNHGATDRMIQDVLDTCLLTGGGMAVAPVRFAYNSFSMRKVMPMKSNPDIIAREEVIKS